MVSFAGEMAHFCYSFTLRNFSISSVDPSSDKLTLTTVFLLLGLKVAKSDWREFSLNPGSIAPTITLSCLLL